MPSEDQQVGWPLCQGECRGHADEGGFPPEADDQAPAWPGFGSPVETEGVEAVPARDEAREALEQQAGALLALTEGENGTPEAGDPGSEGEVRLLGFDPGEGGLPGRLADMTPEELDQLKTEDILEMGGFSVVDVQDASEYAQIRAAKGKTLQKLLIRLQTEVLDSEDLAKIGQKLGQMEKDKMAVIQVKIGKPSDRAKPNVVFRARIGVASKDGTKVAAEFEAVTE